MKNEMRDEKRMEEKLAALLAGIRPADAAAMRAAAERQAKLAKPPGSLGKLEEISIRLAGVFGQPGRPIVRKRILVFCADNGLVAEGIGSAPRSVTAKQAVNMTRFRTGMSVMAHHFGNELRVLDLGIADPYDCPAVLPRRIRLGTGNILHEAAMSRQEALQALLTGAEEAALAAAEGVDAIGIGEMGIGNTSTSSAVLAALTGLPVPELTGRGGGVTDANFAKKIRVIETALARRQPQADDPVDVLAKVGGLDIAAMCGAFLGAAAARIPVLIDGFISAVAALLAARLCPAAKDYFFPSHASCEKGYLVAVRELGLSPYLALDMRLGEGSGCPLAFEVLAAAQTVIREMITFAESAIDDRYLDEIRGEDCFDR